MGAGEACFYPHSPSLKFPPKTLSRTLFLKVIPMTHATSMETLPPKSAGMTPKSPASPGAYWMHRTLPPSQARPHTTKAGELFWGRLQSRYEQCSRQDKDNTFCNSCSASALLMRSCIDMLHRAETNLQLLSYRTLTLGVATKCEAGYLSLLVLELEDVLI